MTYKIAAGYNGTASLTALSIQPTSNGVVSGRRTISGDGTIYEDGFLSCELRYPYLTVTQLTTLLGEFGVGNGTTSAKVTVTVPANFSRADTNYNAIVEEPVVPASASHDRRTWVNVTFRLTRMEAI